MKRPTRTSTDPRPDAPTAFDVSTAGHVSNRDRAYAADKIGKVLAGIGEPVLHTQIRLEESADPSRERPAGARVTIDIAGEPIRAHVRAATMTEAIDLLEARARRRLEHQSEHRQALRRRGPSSPPGEWRHGDAPSERLPHHPRPVEERELVRHKSFTTAAATVDEAVFDLESMDYDFFLYTDADNGQDAVVHRLEGGSYGVQYLDTTEHLPGNAAAAVEVEPEAAPRISEVEAQEQLDSTGRPWLFFCSADSERGHVLYRRYDGHYGLITPAD